MLSERIQEKLASLTFKPHRSLNKERSVSRRRRGSSVGVRSDAGAEPVEDIVADELPVENLPVNVVVRCRPAASSKEPALDFNTDAQRRQGRTVVGVAFPEDVEEKTAYAEELRRYRDRGARKFNCDAFFGPESSQEKLFDHVAPIVERAMEGYCGVILSYGVTGSGKTHSLFGPPGSIGAVGGRSAGIAQRASQLIFDQIREKSAKGSMFVVEASLLEICPADGSKDELVDLLSDECRPLELKLDPLQRSSYTCEGLCRVQIRTPAEMCNMLQQGQRNAQEFARGSRAHTVMTVTIESFTQDLDMTEPIMQLGRLILVDLAGCESYKPSPITSAVRQVGEVLKRTYAIGIARSLTSLGNTLNSAIGGASQPPDKDSALSLLLHGSLGCTARAALIVNLRPELEDVDDTIMSLQFAQHVLGCQEITSVDAGFARPSGLSEMRMKHANLVHELEEQLMGSRDTLSEERQRLREELERMTQWIQERDASDKSLQQRHADQFKKIGEFGAEMTVEMRTELEQLRVTSAQGIEVLKASLADRLARVEEMFREQHGHGQETRVGELKAELQSATDEQRKAEEELAKLRIQLASVEERASMLQDRQQELEKERAEFDEERRNLKEQTDKRWERLVATEGEVNKFKAQVEVHRAEVSRINEAKAADLASARGEKEAWKSQETDLLKTISAAKQLEDDTRRDAEAKATKFQKEKDEKLEGMKSKVKKLEDDAAAQEDQLAKAERERARLEVELHGIEKNESELRQRTADKIKRCHYELKKELQEVQARENELMHMLHEIQESIIHAGSSIPEEEDEF